VRARGVGLKIGTAADHLPQVIPHGMVVQSFLLVNLSHAELLLLMDIDFLIVGRADVLWW